MRGFATLAGVLLLAASARLLSGQAAPPVKFLTITEPPVLGATLQSTAGSVTSVKLQKLYTHAGNPPTLLVGGMPSRYRIGFDPAFTSGTGWVQTGANSATWPALGFFVPGGDGQKTVYLRLKNSAGESPVYSVSFTYLDPTPCAYQLRRNVFPLDSAVVTVSLARGATKQHLASGNRVYRIDNTGPHPIKLNFHQGEIYSGADVGFGLSQVLAAATVKSISPLVWNVHAVTCQ